MSEGPKRRQKRGSPSPQILRAVLRLRQGLCELRVGRVEAALLEALLELEVGAGLAVAVLLDRAAGQAGDDRADRHGHARRQARHRAPAQAREPGHDRHRLRPEEPHVPRRSDPDGAEQGRSAGRRHAPRRWPRRRVCLDPKGRGADCGRGARRGTRLLRSAQAGHGLGPRVRERCACPDRDDHLETGETR